VAAGNLLLFISLLLPWFSVSVISGFSASASAVSARGWMYLPFFVCLATLLYLVWRLASDRVSLPMPHWQALVVTSAFDLLLTVICFLTKPSGTTWSAGAYIGLIAALAALGGSLMRRGEPEQMPADPRR
jgi:formate-dependent nitrite reductase membrane component NrfD